MINGVTVDILALTYCLYCVCMGLYRGVFNIIGDIAGVYGAFFLAWLFKHRLHDVLPNAMALPTNIHPLLSFCLIFFFVYFSVKLLMRLLTRLFKSAGLSIPLRLLGGGLNGIKSVLLIAVLLTCLDTIRPSTYTPTTLTHYIGLLGKTAMNSYKQYANTAPIDIKKMQKTIDPSSIIRDDFKGDRLER